MYKIVKEYSLVISFLLSSPCLAQAVNNDFVYDIVVYAMRSHLNNVTEQKGKTLQSQYAAHASQFREESKKEIEQKLEKKRAELNYFSTILEERRIQLNREIVKYNNLFGQREKKVKEEKALSDKLNKAVQRINKVIELKKQVVFLVQQIRAEVSIVNQRASQMDTLYGIERASWSFYDNKQYLSDDSIVKLRRDFSQWMENINQQLSSKTTDYNNKVEEFDKWQQGQLEAIKAQRNQVEQKLKEQRRFTEEINTLVGGYNQKRTKRCKTKDCERNILSEKEQIEEMKKEYSKKQNDVNQLMLNLNQSEANYNTKHAERIAALNTLKEQVDLLSQSVSMEHVQRNQKLEEQIQVKNKEAKEQWERDKATLDQFQASINIDYGDQFDQFLKYFSHWSTIQVIHFGHFKTDTSPQGKMDQMRAANQNLCEYSNKYPLAVKSKTICKSVTRVYTLLGEIHNSHSGDPIDTWRKKLDELANQIINLDRQIIERENQNERRRSQLRADVEKYNKQNPERQKQYEDFSKLLMNELSKKLQQIRRFYHLKSELLKKEYALLECILFEWEPLDVLMDKRDAFLKSLEQFMNNIPEQVVGLSDNFNQPNEIFSTILEQSGWSIDTFPEVSLFSSINSGVRNRVKQMEDEEKKHIIASWGKTPFISKVLVSAQNRFSDVFKKKDKDKIMLDHGQMFTKTLFLKSVYYYIPIHQVAENSSIRYQVGFDNRVFWILPEGYLEPPKGKYQ